MADFSVSVLVEQPNLHPGDDIRGVAYLNVYKPIITNILVLYLTGHEASQWTERVNHESYESATYTNRGHREIINAQFDLFTYQEEPMKAGLYCYPFTIHTPVDIPSSACFSDTGESQASGSVGYAVEAHMRARDCRTYESMSPIIFTPPLCTDSLTLEHSANVSTWCCFARGVSLLRVTFDKEQYFKGDCIVATLEVDNSGSQVDVSGVTVTVWNTFKLSGIAKISTYKVSRKVAEEVYRERIPRGGDASHTWRKTLELHISEDGSFGASVQGSYVESHLSFTAKVHMAGTIFGRSPVVKKTLQVYAKSGLANELLPRDYSQTLPEQQFTATSKPE